jgi:hypothetical protein
VDNLDFIKDLSVSVVSIMAFAYVIVKILASATQIATSKDAIIHTLLELLKRKD